MSKELTIPFEAADHITVTNLKDCREYLHKELDAYRNGQWLHPEDVVKNEQMIKHLTEVIRYFGGD